MDAEMKGKNRKIIVIKDLKKAYGNIPAIYDLSFSVNERTMFAFLGPNGSGKSTTINLMCSFLKSDSGYIEINEKQVIYGDSNTHKDIGIVFQESLLDPLLTVRENLYYRGKMYGIRGKKLKYNIEKVSNLLGLDGFLNRKYGLLSGGEKRRADIGRAILHAPKLLILDEPTTGLDPNTREKLWEAVKRMQHEEGITVFFSTHYIEEATNADMVVIINKGEILVSGTPDALCEKYVKDKLLLWSANIATLCNACKHLKIYYYVDHERVVIPIDHPFAALPIVDKLRKNIVNFEIINGTLNDAYLNILGNREE